MQGHEIHVLGSVLQIRECWAPSFSTWCPGAFWVVSVVEAGSWRRPLSFLALSSEDAESGGRGLLVGDA